MIRSRERGGEHTLTNNLPSEGGKAPWRVALEDAVTVFLLVLVAVLIADLPGIPAMDQLYAAVLVAGSYGLASWGKARNVAIPAPPTPPST